MPDFNEELKDYIVANVAGITAGYIYSYPAQKNPASQIICVQPSGEVQNQGNNWKWTVTKTILASGTEETASTLAHNIWRELDPLRPEDNGFATDNFSVYKVSTDQKPALLLIDPQGDVAFFSLRLRFFLAES